MSTPIASCPGCGKLGFEWVERDRCGWCLMCGYFEYYSSLGEFIEKTGSDDEPPV
jgi:hypothetical protein